MQPGTQFCQGKITGGFVAEKSTDKKSRPNPTASDVAHLAGVSRTQVSYVLNKKHLEHVSEVNKQKIMEAARELGYQPHSSAQTLRRGYSKEFSIFFPAPYPSRINRLIGDIHEYGLSMDFTPIQYSFNSYEHSERLYEAMDTMLSRKPYGVFCSLMDLKEKDIDYMKKQGVRKFLILDIEEHPEYPTLYLPVSEVAALAASHLYEKGYRKIIFLKPSDPVQQKSFQIRYDSFIRNWPEKGSLNLTVQNWREDVFRPDMDSAREYADRMPGGNEAPQAIYAYNDDYALHLLTALRERGKRIPEDIAVLGTDNSDYTSVSFPKLTTIQMDRRSLGYRAVALMNHLISGEELAKEYLCAPRPVLIEREST